MTKTVCGKTKWLENSILFGDICIIIYLFILFLFTQDKSIIVAQRLEWWCKMKRAEFESKLKAARDRLGDDLDTTWLQQVTNPILSSPDAFGLHPDNGEQGFQHPDPDIPLSQMSKTSTRKKGSSNPPKAEFDKTDIKWTQQSGNLTTQIGDHSLLPEIQFMQIKPGGSQTLNFHWLKSICDLNNLPTSSSNSSSSNSSTNLAHFGSTLSAVNAKATWPNWDEPTFVENKELEDRPRNRHYIYILYYANLGACKIGYTTDTPAGLIVRYIKNLPPATACFYSSLICEGMQFTAVF